MPDDPRNAKIPSASPARFARLARGFAIILIREALAVTAAIASAATAAASWAAAFRRPAFALGARFIHLQIAAADLFPVEARNRLGCFRVVGHLDKRKSPGAARFAIHCQVDPRDLSKRREERAQIRFRRLKTHIADKQILHAPHSPSLLKQNVMPKRRVPVLQNPTEDAGRSELKKNGPRRADANRA